MEVLVVAEATRKRASHHEGSRVMREDKVPRYSNIVLGVWLFFSAFLWRHAAVQHTNTWLMGLVTVLVSLMALRRPVARYVNTLVGVWVIISSYMLPGTLLDTRSNNVLVGFFIAYVSLLGAKPRSAALGDPPLKSAHT
jgi:hypothetical protein